MIISLALGRRRGGGMAEYVDASRVAFTQHP